MLPFDAADPQSLADVLETIRRDPAAAVERGLATAAHAEARFSWEAVTQRYIELFEALRAGRTRPTEGTREVGG